MTAGAKRPKKSGCRSLKKKIGGTPRTLDCRGLNGWILFSPETRRKLGIRSKKTKKISVNPVKRENSQKNHPKNGVPTVLAGEKEGEAMLANRTKM